MSADKYTAETITDIQTWAPHLFSFKTTRSPAFRFIPGQFARLGLKKADGSMVWRPYSMVSADYAEALEFYSIVVPEGEFTPLLAECQVGDTLYVDKTSFGFLTLDRFEGGKDLWLLSTGTGIAPFISHLYDFSTWEQYERIVLVHSVRYHRELAYENLLQHFNGQEGFEEFAGKLHYLQLVTRERVAGALHGRVTDLLENGALEKAVGFGISEERARIMICGNPQMVEDTRQVLLARGLRMTRSKTPGHIAVENYW